MGITSSNKTISVDRIDCDGSLQVSLALTAAPDIMSNPVDIVLVLDRSGSMAGEPLTAMKAGADTFIDIIAEATGGTASGQIGFGSRIGIVSFSDTAVADTQLITSVAALKLAVGSLTAGGRTNHAAAFTLATQLFDPVSANDKVIVMFTDGNTTVGAPPAPVAAAAKAQGIVIYAIGLVGSGGLDVAALNEWASDPDSTHVSIAPTPEELEQLFADLAANITKPGATDIVIHEVVNPDFIITSVLPPDKGTATMLDASSLRWNIPALGVSASESALLRFVIRHVGVSGGDKKVNESITYSDHEGNKVDFPDPTVTVECGMVDQPEPCPEPVELSVDSCSDSVVVDLGDTRLESLGRILQLSVTIKNVCPGRRVALAIVLTEVDDKHEEHPRGMKTFTVPAHHQSSCRDVLVRCVKFVVPEDLNVSGGDTRSLCHDRNFKARVIAHYIDTDFRCCEDPVTL